MGASLTCGSDAIPDLLRPCSLMAPRAALYLPPKQHALPRHIPELREIKAVVLQECVLSE